MSNIIIVPTLYEYALSDMLDDTKWIIKTEAENLFIFFKNHPLFNWADVHNNCEARAEAVCILLNSWGIPHYKGWVFSGAFLKKHVGGLKQFWNYHVAAMVPVQQNGKTECYVIDPATANGIQTMYNWAANVTDYAHSYHLIKLPEYYIFPTGKILKFNWHKRNKQNRKWAMQGLAGINGLSGKGKAQLCFKKKTIRMVTQQFLALIKHKPF